MIEQKINADIARVHDLLTQPKWLEQRCLDLAELSAVIKREKRAKGVVMRMQRRVKHDLPGLVAKVLSPVTDIVFVEHWTPEADGYSGEMSIELIGQPVTASATFSLRPAGKACVYRSDIEAHCRVPLVGGVVAKFVLGKLEKGCTDELNYLIRFLKTHK